MKRAWAVKRSVPTPASHRPRNKANRPLIIDAPDSSTTSARPRHMSAKYSGELKESANAATCGAISVSAMTPIVPATKDEIAAMPSAAPALPRRAIWYPSRQVATEELSPGMLRRIDVVEPPYLAP